MKSSSVLDKIRASGEKPVPAWRFALSRWGVRAALVAAVALAAVAAGLALLEAWEPGADMAAGRFRRMPGPWAFHAMPLLWSVLAAAGVAAALLLFRRLPTGYRWRGAAVAGIVASCAVALCAAAMAAGGPRLADRFLRSAMPGYAAWSDERREEFFRDVWMRPQDGVIAGAAQSVTETGFALRALDGSVWSVAHSGAASHPALAASGARVRAFGEMTGSGEFRADDVRPLMRKGGFGRMGGGEGRGGFRDLPVCAPGQDPKASPDAPPACRPPRGMGGPRDSSGGFRGMMGGPRGEVPTDPAEAPQLP